MTILQSLNIHNLRNIVEANLSFHENYNLIYGYNGSGKTSVLESIYLLANGKSFRSSQKAHIISHNNDEFTIFAKVSRNKHIYKIGLQKSHSTNARLQINGEKSRSLAAAAEILPVIMVDPNSYGLIEEGPGYRRQYLDWILFHVEHGYAKIVQDYNKCLKQRNSALKQQLSPNNCKAWDEQLVVLGEQITKSRKKALELLLPYYQGLIETLNVGFNVELNYYPGWDGVCSLDIALNHSFNKDMAIGYTSVGPQRADVLFQVNSHPAADVLSRGQEKLTVSCLLFAQGLYYEVQTNNSPIYLIDDLVSELDEINSEKLFNLLADDIPGQKLITATSKDHFPASLVPEASMFHVEHGKLAFVDKTPALCDISQKR